MKNKPQHISVCAMEEARIVKGFSKMELAKRAGLGPTTYDNWLRGYMPTIENAHKVFCALGITYTLGRDDQSSKSETPDEYLVGINGEMIGISWNDDNPKKLLKRLNQIDERLKKLEKEK